MLLGSLLHRPPYLDWVELAVALAAGLAAIWLLHYSRPARAAAIVLATVAALIGFELASFRLAGLLFDGTYPAVTLLAAFGVMLVGTLRAAEAELVREREAKQLSNDNTFAKAFEEYVEQHLKGLRKAADVERDFGPRRTTAAHEPPSAPERAE